MPLISSKITIPNGHILIWHLTESLEELHAQPLHPSDQADFALVHHPQKQREWLASRLLLIHTCQAAGISYHGLEKDEHGKPFLIGSTQHLSVTHSKDFVAIAIATQPIGIDIEKPSEKLMRVQHKFLSEEEIKSAQASTYALCAYWCGKEAVFKLWGKHGVSFRENIQLQLPVSSVNNYYTYLTLPNQQLRYQIMVHEVTDYLLAVAY